MNELFKLIRQHHEKNEAGTSLVSKVSTILDSLPDGSVNSSQLAGFDQFHVMGLEATEQLAQIADVECGATILDAGSGLGGPSRYLASTYGCRVIGADLSPSFVAVAQLLAQRTGLNALVSYQIGDLLALPFPDSCFDVAGGGRVGWSRGVGVSVGGACQTCGHRAQPLVRRIALRLGMPVVPSFQTTPKPSGSHAEIAAKSRHTMSPIGQLIRRIRKGIHRASED